MTDYTTKLKSPDISHLLAFEGMTVGEHYCADVSLLHTRRFLVDGLCYRFIEDDENGRHFFLSENGTHLYAALVTPERIAKFISPSFNIAALRFVPAYVNGFPAAHAVEHRGEFLGVLSMSVIRELFEYTKQRILTVDEVRAWVETRDVR